MVLGFYVLEHHGLVPGGMLALRICSFVVLLAHSNLHCWFHAAKHFGVDEQVGFLDVEL